MYREPFLSRRPSHFVVNPFIKAFIISETLLWSSWNFIFPIIAIFVVNGVADGSIEIAALAYSTYLFTRVVMELISGNFLNKVSERLKLSANIVGMIIVCFSYLGFVFASNIFSLLLAYASIGVGLGISTPSKLALFSKHLDPGKVSTEWSLYDAMPFTGMAIAGIIGGLIVKSYGFDTLFCLAAIVNFMGILPYYFVYRNIKTLSKG